MFEKSLEEANFSLLQSSFKISNPDSVRVENVQCIFLIIFELDLKHHSIQ